MNNVFARVPTFLIALALAFSIGAHWAVLQVVAWTGMVISYSQEAPLTEAVAKTFDGKHPCCLCKQIAKAKHAGKSPEYRFELGKLEFPRACEESMLLDLPGWSWQLRAGNTAADRVPHDPKVPPPRRMSV